MWRDAPKVAAFDMKVAVRVCTPIAALLCSGRARDSNSFDESNDVRRRAG